MLRIVPFNGRYEAQPARAAARPSEQPAEAASGPLRHPAEAASGPSRHPAEAASGPPRQPGSPMATGTLAHARTPSGVRLSLSGPIGRYAKNAFDLQFRTLEIKWALKRLQPQISDDSGSTNLPEIPKSLRIKVAPSFSQLVPQSTIEEFRGIQKQAERDLTTVTATAKSQELEAVRSRLHAIPREFGKMVDDLATLANTEASAEDGPVVSNADIEVWKSDFLRLYREQRLAATVKWNERLKRILEKQERRKEAQAKLAQMPAEQKLKEALRIQVQRELAKQLKALDLSKSSRNKPKGNKQSSKGQRKGTPSNNNGQSKNGQGPSGGQGPRSSTNADGSRRRTGRGSKGRGQGQGSRVQSKS